jgi:hypothetical protein
MREDRSVGRGLAGNEPLYEITRPLLAVSLVAKRTSVSLDVGLFMIVNYLDTNCSEGTVTSQNCYLADAASRNGGRQVSMIKR